MGFQEKYSEWRNGLSLKGKLKLAGHIALSGWAVGGILNQMVISLNGDTSSNSAREHNFFIKIYQVWRPRDIIHTA